MTEFEPEIEQEQKGIFHLDTRKNIFLTNLHKTNW